jgi:hypothetical protein
MKEIWLKYQGFTGNSLDTIINERFKDKDYIIWLEDELEKQCKLKGILYNVGSDDLTVDQAIKLINKL